MKRKIAITLMSVGVLLIGFAMGLLIYNNYENRRAQESADTLIQTIRLDIAEKELKNEAVDPFDER